MADISTVAIFRQNKGAIEVLIGTRHDDSLVLPGGRLDKGESPHAAAVREVREETGIHVQKLTKLHTTEDGKKTIHSFCVKVDADVKLKPDDDIAKLRWYKITQVPALERGHNVIVSEGVRKLFGNHLSGTFSDFLKKKDSGLLIVFEGLDGAGKTSQIDMLCKWLAELGIDYVHSKWRSSPLLEKPIDKAKDARELTPKLFNLLHAADMIHRYETEIKPALESGKVVVCDRYWYTSMARDAAHGIKPLFVREMYSDLREPDILFYISVGTELACQRAGDSKGLKHYSSGMDVTGAESKEESCPIYMGMQKKVYDRELRKVPSFVKIDSTRSIERVFSDIKSKVASALLVSQR